MKSEYKIEDPKIRFERFIEKTDGCWNWIGTLDHDGYGTFTIRSKNCKHASKYSWIFYRGIVPKGMFVLHKCDNRKCVNPDHLYVGTAKQNSHDRDSRGRQCVGSNHPLSKLTAEKVIEMRELYQPFPKRGRYSKLAEKYGVDRTLVMRIIQRRTWKHI